MLESYSSFVDDVNANGGDSRKSVADMARLFSVAPPTGGASRPMPAPRRNNRVAPATGECVLLLTINDHLFLAND